MESTVALEARALTVGYGSHAVISGVTFSVSKGERWAVLGPNGAGKSTLMRTLLGIQPALAGEVRVLGRPVTDWPRRDLSQVVAWVPQHFDPPEGFTGLELVLMGRSPHLGLWGLAGPHEEARAREVLEELGAGALADRPVGAMSGGEQRLLALARGLLQAGGLLLLDEPTAFLDLRHQLETLERVAEHATGGVAAVCVLHDVNLAQAWASHVLLVGDGHQIAAGPAGAILDAETLSRLYGVGIESGVTPGGRRLFAPRSLR
jgi:iron complex transport system ATP-binding protein